MKKQKLDPDTLAYFREQGKIGGETLKKTKPKSYYSDIVKKRWAKWHAEREAAK